MGEIDELLQHSQRKLVISQNDISLDKKTDNKIFVLMVEESKGSAGGRAAGSGSRRITRIHGFSSKNGICSRIFDSEAESTIERFDIPYSAVAMDIKLSDGRSYVVQGVVDLQLISAYLNVTSNVGQD